MSADNYYTVKPVSERTWGLFHGFMTDLEEGRVATHLEASSFISEEEAINYFFKHQAKYWSEYGLIVEDDTAEAEGVVYGSGEAFLTSLKPKEDHA